MPTSVQNLHTWRVLDINHQDNMVVLVSSDSPIVKRYGAPNTIAHVEVVMEHLHIQCEDGVCWCINILDGSRRKAKPPTNSDAK